jgi:hypothetical protein
MKYFWSQLQMLVAFFIGCVIGRLMGYHEVMASGVLCAVCVLAAKISQE